MLAIHRDTLGFLTRTAAQYGDLACFSVGPIRVLLLNDPEYIRHVLQTNSRNFVKGRPLYLAKRLLGDGLLTTEGDVHHHQSRTVQPAFHAEQIDSYGAVMAECAVRWSRRWHDGDTVDMMEEMAGLAATIAGRTLFTWDIPPETAVGVVRALAEATSLFTRASIPFSEWLLKLPLPSTRRFYRAKAHLDGLIDALIVQRRRDGGDGGDVLDMLLGAQASSDRPPASGTEVRDQALTLFLTALDTTSLALTWTWYALSQHPDAEAELHAEVDRVLADGVPSPRDVAELRFARMVLLEAMRLYPPIYAIAREALDPFEVGGHTIPAGTLVLMSPYVMQRDDRYYPEPTQFRPRRWDPEATSRPVKGTYFPFGGGPRGCIGQSYAMLEGVLVLATLARRWRMRLVPGHPVTPLPLINLRPKHGMRMALERRGNAADRGG